MCVSPPRKVGWHCFSGVKPTPELRDIGKSEGLQQAKIRGNRAFESKSYKEAINYYTKGIEILDHPDKQTKALLHSNRSECYLRTREFEKALDDANAAGNGLPDPRSRQKAALRKLKAQRGLAQYHGAIQTAKLAIALDRMNVKVCIVRWL